MFISGKFLQSNEWEKFQESLGRKIFWVDGALVIKMPLKFGLSYLYCPKNNISDLEKIKKIAKEERAIFLRVEPHDEPEINFIKTRDIQPKCTQILDLAKSEEKLLAEMHKKTRYNIHLAERKGVRFGLQLTADSLQLFDEFYNLLQETAKKQKIRLHSEEYYRKLSEFNEIFIAYYNNEAIACAMVNFYDGVATYLHGGSTQKYKEMMAPYLLHWEIIKTAKVRGMKFYNWWGVDEKKWPGITRFKKGFGGEELCSPGTFDLPINKFFYQIYKLLRK